MEFDHEDPRFISLECLANLTGGEVETHKDIILNNVAHFKDNYGGIYYLAIDDSVEMDISLLGCPDRDSMPKLADFYGVFTDGAPGRLLRCEILDPLSLPIETDEGDDYLIFYQSKKLAGGALRVTKVYTMEAVISSIEKLVNGMLPIDIENIAVVAAEDLEIDEKEWNNGQYGTSASSR